MKKISALLLLAIILITAISGCGSDINNNTDKKIKVTIPFNLSAKALQKSNQINNSNNFYGPAPSNIRSIRVDVLYPNGVKISKQINIAGGAYVEVNMELDEGTNIYFYAFAYDGYEGTGNLLYSGASPPQTLKNNMSYEIIINMSPARTPPSVASVTPSNGATGVAINTLISATFSEVMDTTTIDTTTFMISGGTAGTVTYSGQTATFKPSINLMPNTNYTVTITTGAKNSLGIPISSNYTWSFTTGASADTTPLTVSSHTPISGATNVLTSGIITIIFSETLDTASLTTSTITLSPNPGYSVNYSGGSTTVTVVPTTSLSLNTTYTVTVTTGVKDTAGNVMASPYSWSFTTEGGGDTTPPGVSSVSPSLGATGVAINTSIAVTFSETMDSSTITNSTFTISGGVTGSVSYSGKTAIFTPSASLSYNTTYTATITKAVKDTAGNAMASSYSWSFTTGTSNDATPPTVSSHTPVSGATNVLTSGIITIIFSEALDSTSLTTSTITLSPNPGYSVNYSGGSTTVTLVPTTNLSLNTTYTVTVTTGVKDTAGNVMASPYSWSFTTEGEVILRRQV